MTSRELEDAEVPFLHALHAVRSSAPPLAGLASRESSTFSFLRTPGLGRPKRASITSLDHGGPAGTGKSSDWTACSTTRSGAEWEVAVTLGIGISTDAMREQPWSSIMEEGICKCHKSAGIVTNAYQERAERLKGKKEGPQEEGKEGKNAENGRTSLHCGIINRTSWRTCLACLLH